MSAISCVTALDFALGKLPPNLTLESRLPNYAYIYDNRGN
jgi:hypothetical protein